MRTDPFNMETVRHDLEPGLEVKGDGCFAGIAPYTGCGKNTRQLTFEKSKESVTQTLPLILRRNSHPTQLPCGRIFPVRHQGRGAGDAVLF